MEGQQIGIGIIYQGHVLDVLGGLPDESVQCVVTSPPYWGLRDYKIEPQVWDAVEGCEHEWGEDTTPARNETKHSDSVHKEGYKDAFRNSKDWVDHKVDSSPAGGSFCLRCGAWRGSLGLEPTPELFVRHIVDIFREVRRVLKPSGCLFLNLGDSFASGKGTCYNPGGGKSSLGQARKDEGVHPLNRGNKSTLEVSGLKPKDLCGIPWRVARALQEPYYTGQIKDEKDRYWLAGLFDGEGCFGIRRQSSSGNRNPEWNDSYIPYSTIKMSDRAPLDRAAKITGLGEVRAEAWKVGEDSRKVKTVRIPYTWRLDGNKAVQLARELYPYLLVKQNQAACICTLDDSNKDKRRGRGNAVPKEVIKERDDIWITIKALNQRKIETLPPFIHLPESLYEPGWYLRSDIIWSKPNPMPESVTDRPTKSHEYLFLLAKSQKYFWDQEAVREEASYPKGANAPDKIASPYGQGFTAKRSNGSTSNGRNIRSVWTIATQATPEAHFATFPEKLVEPCIKAGTSEKGCCPKCGKPWVPVTKRVVGENTEWMGRGPKSESLQGQPGGGVRGKTMNIGSKDDYYANQPHNEVTGWRPTCTCGEEKTVPCVVLDPFFGSGTVGIVAEKLNRKWIGIELNPEYIKIAEKRLEQKANVRQVNFMKQ